MLKGHPKGLFRLFFIEMWERLAFYTMVGILLLYTLDNEKGGLGLPQSVGSEIYGLYLAFVYFTPYLGGMIADRFLGYRKSVLIGAILFATGFFLMSIYGQFTFVTGLVFLCVGNGLFKPNISAMVGNLYSHDDPKRDSGFNIFYMGINIGAFAANFLAAIMKNEIGWLAIFFAAGVGMCISIVILLWSWKTLEKADRKPAVHPEQTPFGEIMTRILGPALVSGVIGYFLWDAWAPASWLEMVRPSDFGFLVGAVPIIAFFVNLARRASPDEKPGLLALLPIYVAGGTFFMVLHLNGSAMTMWARDLTDREVAWAQPDEQGDVPAIGRWFAQETFPGYYKNASAETPRPNQLSLLPVDNEVAVKMYGQKRMSPTVRLEIQNSLPDDVEAVVLRSDADWSDLVGDAAFEPRAVDIFSEVTVEDAVGAHGEKLISVSTPDGAKPTSRVAFVRTIGEEKIATYLVAQETYDEMFAGYEKEYGQPPPQLPPGKFLRTANPELYQSLNPFFVVSLTPLVVAFFAFMLNRNRKISTARKIFFGMVITGIAVLFMAMAGFMTDNGAVKVSWLYLVGFFLIITVGELCLSPMALSLVTKLSPGHLVGLTMGGWFFATAVGNKFSGFLGGLQGKMEPAWFFLTIAMAVGVVALGLFLLLPKLDRAINKYGA